MKGLDFWNEMLHGEGVAELEEVIDGQTYLVVNRNGKRTIERVEGTATLTFREGGYKPE